MPTLKAQEIIVSPVIIDQKGGEITAFLIQNYSGDDDISSSPIWELPRIAVKFGEHPDDAVIQGVKQRIGTKGLSLGLLSCDSYTYKTYNTTIHSIRIVYIVKQENGFIPILNEQYYKGYKWIKKQEMEYYRIVDSDKEVLKMVFSNDNLLLEGNYHV